MNETHLHLTLEQLAQLSAGMFGDYWCLFQYQCSWYITDLCLSLSPSALPFLSVSLMHCFT